jgi:hypothetical protein
VIENDLKRYESYGLKDFKLKAFNKMKMSKSLFSALATHGICLCELNVVTITHLMTT